MGVMMFFFRVTTIAALAVLTMAFSATEGSAQQKLCVSSTGATRVIDATERCKKIETTVEIPEAVVGETIKTSSYLVPSYNPNNYLGLYSADGGTVLNIYCSSPLVGWSAMKPEIQAGDISIFNDISGEQFQAFNDLQYNSGMQDHAVVPALPWTGTFTAKYGKSLTRYEVTVSRHNARNCLMTVFSVGFGNAIIHKN